MSRRKFRRDQTGRRIGFRLFKLSVVLSMLGASGFYGFQVGQRLGREEVAALQSRIDTLSAEGTQARDEATRLAVELDAARKRGDEFEAKYAEVAPSEETRDILAAVRAKLASGFDSKRLAFVVQAAEKPRRCGGEDTKRFMVKTPHFDGNATWVRFADLITVTASGQGGGGGAEQAYDPDKPVSVKFTVLGGKETEVQGKLPLHHSMVVKNGEYRFTIAPGAKGFVEVTGDRCDYKG